MRRFLVCCVVTSVTLLGALGSSSARAGDSRCEVLQDIVPATIGAVTGDTAGAARHALDLRELADAELTPDRYRPPLRKLARFFERVPDLEIVERAESIGALFRALAKVTVFSAEVCEGTTTTSTSRPLR